MHFNFINIDYYASISSISHKILSRILERNIDFKPVGGYRPLPSESPRSFSSSWVSLSPILTPSRLALFRCDSSFSSSSSPSFSPLKLLHGGSDGAGNVSFVRGPVSAGSSNHLFPSSLGYIWLYTPSHFASPLASSPVTRSPNTFLRLLMSFLFSLHLPSPTTSSYHPRLYYTLFSARVSYHWPVLALEITPRFLAASRVHEWTRSNRLEAWRRRGVTEPGLSDLRMGRFGAHLSTTTPFDLASSTTPKTWTLGRQNYAIAHDYIGSSALASRRCTRHGEGEL